ncbi:MAG: bifunctional methylenetetrahydrofolate dehydrogenase/methenyltetrahydrofolate cyclohydrolase, partial [Coriobacteriia bacterium]|nr:bifunctional methylenetetrahydrofolate dehydrogenase/methenyltetrahydrofolate cyclohydrolase [Coriobacteriia bacterium]
MATMIDGVKLAAEVREQAARAAGEIVAGGVTPCLAVVLVGDDPASASYVRMKERDCIEVGIESRDHRLPETISQSDLDALIDELNADPAIHGILVQMPLPAHLDAESVIARIAPEKDVDGFHPESLGRLV